MKQKRTQGMAVIALLISLVVAGIIVYVAITLYTGDSDQTIKTPIERSKGVQCLSQIRRIETSLQIYRIDHGQYPSNLDGLEDLLNDEFFCPVTGSPYQYNSVTGQVTCPDHP